MVTLKKDVFTKKLNFAVAGREVQIAGNFEGGAKVGGVAGAAGAVDFGTGGTITFNALPNQPKTFNATIVNGNNGILNVQGNLTATHADIGKINTINIGGGTLNLGILSINASAADVDLLDKTAAGAGPGAAINFLDKNSILRLYTEGHDRTITFHNALAGFNDGVVDHGGIVVLQGTDVNTLFVQSKGGTKTLGTKDDPLDELQVRGNVTIRGVDKGIYDAAVKADPLTAVVINEINVRNAKKLNIINEATFLDESLTSQYIPEIHIGATDGTGTGRANYILNTQYYDFDILSGGSRIIFDDPDAQLTLQSSSNFDNTIIFKGDLEGIAGVDGGGVVLLESLNANRTLIARSDDGTRTLGTKKKNLKELQVRGKVIIGEMDDAAAAIAEAARITAGGTEIVANRLDVSNAKKLNVIKGAVFTDESSTSAQIAEIHIGAADGPAPAVGPAPGAATYVLDAIYGDFDILKGSVITFDDATAQLTLRNSSAAKDRTITFHDNLAGFNRVAGVLPAVDHGGIVSLESEKDNTLTLKSDNGTRTLGTAGLGGFNIGELQVRGKVTIVGTDKKLNVGNVKKLNVMKGAVFTDESSTSTQIAEINIGANGGGAVAGVGQANYIIDAKYNDNVNILNGKTIVFKAENAQLTLRNSSATKNRTIIFNNSLEGFSDARRHPVVEHGGIVSLESEKGGTLTLKSDDGTRTLGTAAHKIGELQVRGQVTIVGNNKALNVSNAKKLNVINGAIFTDESATSAKIAEINIGVKATPGGKEDTADYILDAKYGDFTILANVDDQINFLHENAKLILRNSHGRDNKTITLRKDLDPGDGGVDPFTGNRIGKGIVQLESVYAGRLAIAGAYSLGTNDHNLKEIRITGAGQVEIEPAIYAKTITLNVAQLTTNAVSGNINFLANTAFTANGNIGDVNFNATAGTITLANGMSIGTVKGNGNNGTLNFAGAGRAGAINGIAAVNFDRAGDVNLGAARATIFDIKHANVNVITAGPLNGRVLFTAPGKLTAGADVGGAVDFNGGGTLIFNKPVVPGALPTTFSSTIANGNNGTLNVQTNLRATNNADIGKIKTINIGTALAEQTLTIDATAGDVALLGNGGIVGAANQTINFAHAGSVLGLYANAAGKIITFHDHLPGTAANEGTVLLEGAGNTLTVQSATGGETLGIAAAKLAKLQVRGQVTILGDIHKLDIHNTLVLDIIKDAVFTDESATSAEIPAINIGEKATYVLDAEHGNINILTGTNQINFLHEDAQLTLRNSKAGNGRITLDRVLDPGADGRGIVEFDSVVLGNTLTIDGGSLGTGGYKLKEVIFSGDGKFKIDSHIYTTNIMLNAREVELGDVTSDITFVKDTTLNANGHINGRVDFVNHAGIINLKADKNITGSVTGVNGTLVFIGNGSVGGLITDLGMLRAGAGNVTLIAGNHSITEIQGNGEQNLIFADGFNLAGGINLTAGGQAVGLIFNGNGSISGGVGTNSTVGDIQIQAGTVAFGSSIKAKDINISAGATAKIVENTTATNIKGGGKVKFNNKKELILDTPISIDTMEVAGTNVKITKVVSGSNIHFSNSDPVTLTLEASSNVNNITAGGNGVHSMALAADFTTTGNIGSESNRLKEIKLLGDHTFSIKGSIYSPILTTTDNSGKVIFNLDDSVAYGNLGEEKVRLADVTFDSNSKVKADVYSKKITIKGDKTATFAGTEKRTIDVPGVARLFEKFTYSTQIVSEEINAEGSSKMKFDNAALINAPINGGQMILADNVWFKEEVKSAASVTFAPDKYVILEKNIAFSNIEASQAKIIILSEKQAITGELAAKDLTIDLGTNQLKYAGNTKLTGELKLRSFYDSSKLSGGNIEIQSNSKLDLSQLDKLLVTIVGQTDISKMPEDTQYVLISSVDGNGISTLDPSKVDLEINEQNRFVNWTIDPRNLTLYAKDIHKKVLKEEIEELKEKSEKTQDSAAASRLLKRATLLEQLHDVTDKNSDAFKYSDEIGKMDKDNAELSVDKLLPGNTNPISMELAFMVSEAISQVTSQISSRSVNMLPVASGDDDKVTYGVWGSPFYAVGHQKMRKGISGYRSKSIGGIFGFDGLINDDLLVGLAYSKIDTKMSHKDLKFGDKTNGITNLFSLYGSYKFPNNFFAEAVASYGITDIKNAEGRIVLDDKNSVTTGTAVAKYKSTSYSGQLLTGYNYQPSEKLTIMPTIGLRYSQFMDDSHVESGTAWQNLTVKKTSYNKFEGILGLRTATNIQLDQLLLIPELHGYVNYDFKGKSPKIDARLGGMNEPFPTQSVKPTKVSFTVGTGLTVKFNMMEYGVTYNAHIADKYIGHQGSLKVKVNF